MYTQDRNQDSAKCTLRTGIRTVRSVHSGQESGQREAYTQDRNQGVWKAQPGQESEQCERHTRNRYREFTRAKTKTQLGQCEVHSTGQEVYTQDRHQYSVKCTLRQCEVYTLDRNQDSVSVKCTPGQESWQCEEHTQDRTQESVKYTFRTVWSLRSGQGYAGTGVRGIGTVWSVHAEQKSGQWEATYRTVLKAHLAQESGECEVYTQDRSLESVKCTLRTGIRTVRIVHPGHDLRQCEVYYKDKVKSTIRTTWSVP